MTKHYIITNRQVYNEGKRNERLRRDGKEEARDELRFGVYEFDENNPADEGEVKLLKDLSEKEAERSFAKQTNSKFPSFNIFSEMYTSMVSIGAKSDVLVFIHGFK
jgi:hypothetical protein